MEHLTTEQVAKINKVPLAKKFDCSASYIAQVLKGQRKSKTKKAKAILENGLELIKLIEGEPAQETQSQNL